MSGETPTVVFVHGAFADSSSWNGVIERLLEQGVNATAPANPLRGIAHDSAYTASVFDQTPGPVLAVGHSYGGAVITNAASQAKNVVGLVFVSPTVTDHRKSTASSRSTPRRATHQIPSGSSTAPSICLPPYPLDRANR